MLGERHGSENHLRSAAEELATIDLESLVAPKRPAELNFVMAKGHLAAALSTMTALGLSDLDLVPESMLKGIWEAEKPLLETIRSIASFHKGDVRDAAMRNQYANSLTASYERFFKVAAPIIGFSRQPLSNLEERERLARIHMQRIEAIHKEASEIQRLMIKQKADSVVASEAKHFQTESRTYRIAAHYWLGGIVAFGVSTALLALYIGTGTSPDRGDSVQALVLGMLPRLVVLSLSFYGLALCARNYRANRHNFIANQHRAIALQTFSVFVGAASDEKVKDAVLAQAASTIFSAQPSGYSADQAEPLPQATAVELLQRIAGR